MSTTGERYNIIPKDLEAAREAGRPPKIDLIRDSNETVELRREGADLPVLSDYGARPGLAARVAEFVRWLEEQFEER